MKQHHKIEIFSANCPLCKHIIDDIQIGKCEGCSQIVYDLTKMTEEIKVKMKDYGVKAVPTTIIDGNIKVVGIDHIHKWDKLNKSLSSVNLTIKSMLRHSISCIDIYEKIQNI
ncbi:MAG TPA: thioredoxin family protein [Nitrososphaeraceae archaeon]